MAEAEELKACTKCGELKPLSDYSPYADKRRGTSGLRWHCRACSSASATQWAKDNRERRNAAQLANYHRKKGDPEFMERKREAGRQTARRTYAHRKEQQSEYYRRKRQGDPAGCLVRGAKSRAKMKGLPFDLTLEWAREKYTGRCELTELEFKPQIGVQCPFSPSIDRIVPELGYVQSNCRFVLSALNSLKQNGTDEDLLLIARALVEKAK